MTRDQKLAEDWASIEFDKYEGSFVSPAWKRRYDAFIAGRESFREEMKLTETEQLRMKQARELLEYPNYVPYLASLLQIITRLTQPQDAEKETTR